MTSTEAKSHCLRLKFHLKSFGVQENTPCDGGCCAVWQSHDRIMDVPWHEKDRSTADLELASNPVQDEPRWPLSYRHLSYGIEATNAFYRQLFLLIQ